MKISEMQFSPEHPVVKAAKKRLEEHIERQVFGMTIEELLALRETQLQQRRAVCPAVTSFSVLDTY